MGITLLLLIWVMMMMITVYNSAKQFTDAYSKQFNLVATIFNTDLDNSMHEKKLTKEQYLKFGESKYVKAMQMVANLPVIFDELTTEGQNSQNVAITGTYASQLDAIQATAVLTGLDNMDLEKQLDKSNQKIIEGQDTLKLNECLISVEVARINQLKIGDKIAFTVIGGNQSEKQELTVAGIYQQKKEDAVKPASGFSATQENQIFTTMETLTAGKDFDKYGYTSTSYDLENSATLQKFEKELREKGLPDELQIATNEDNLKLMLNPVNGIRMMTGIILLGFLFISSFSLIFLSVRRFKKITPEITVMRNIGISKKELMLSHLIELIVVTFIACSIAFLLTKFTVQPFADWQLNKQNQLSPEITQLISLLNTANAKEISTIPMIINVTIVIETLGVALSFLMIILTVDGYKLFKFESIEFMLERNFDE
ncbi:ABC transporter, permease protein [Enterococcus sp. 5H]|nr:ABC transporter, permease protein [Enterococcus sp. 5H]